ncbi:Glucooligosaccharide oxidase [Cadophora sp. DSE1049]|nr:Glucooligosaccharide oxidase [Cadophora sp. DSE1049]
MFQTQIMFDLAFGDASSTESSGSPQPQPIDPNTITMRFSRLLISSLLFMTSAQAASYSPRKSRSDVIDCLTSHNFPFVGKNSPNWTSYATPYNLRLVYEPAVITIPETPEHVSSSVTCAAAAGLKVQAKGGGHSYASYSSGGQDGSLIIDMEKFASVERLGNVATKIFEQGKRALPPGTCPGVGIAGHALHGGYGYASRKWSITPDTIVGLDVVLANGSQVHTTSERYPDVFYAMRGAGESFGIVTYFYMQTQAAPSSVLYFAADLAVSLRDVETVTSGFEKLQNFSLTSPLLTPSITFGMYTDSNGIFSLSGWCMDCKISLLRNTILPAMLAGFPGSVPTITPQSWIEALTNLGVPQAMTQPLGHECSFHDTFYAKSLVMKNSRPLSTSAIRAFWSYMLANQGKAQFYSIIDLYGGSDSAINTPDQNSSAYSHRDALWVFQNYVHTANSQPPFDPALVQLADGLNAAVENAQANGDFMGYLNYVDSSLSAMTAAESYYGAETYNKLLGIKTELDPMFVF